MDAESYEGLDAAISSRRNNGIVGYDDAYDAHMGLKAK